ncbi:MAG: hypothetical protein LJE70_19955 [Chromatiaceae bacterium]|jgi:CheY-like chemotaxis protein|nr:hypothetical protein [Chromatiaceae bacterium]
MEITPEAIDSNDEILVVDDTPVSLMILTDLLMSHGCRVRPSDDSRLALESALAAPRT